MSKTRRIYLGKRLIKYVICRTSIFTNMMAVVSNSTIFLIITVLIFVFGYYCCANVTFCLIKIWLTFFICQWYYFLFVKVNYRLHAVFLSVCIVLIFYTINFTYHSHNHPKWICSPSYVVDNFSGLYLHPDSNLCFISS